VARRLRPLWVTGPSPRPQVALGSADHGGVRQRRRGIPGTNVRYAPTVLLYVSGTVLTIATFTRWPLVAIIGLIIQAVAAWSGLRRWGPRLGAEAERAARRCWRAASSVRLDRNHL
jgi:hypothetical protein